MSRKTPDWLVIKRPGSPVLFFICMLTILAIGWTTDYKSCLRQKRPREAVTATRTYLTIQAERLYERAEIDTGRSRELDIKSADAARYASTQLVITHLKCKKLFPPT